MKPLIFFDKAPIFKFARTYSRYAVYIKIYYIYIRQQYIRKLPDPDNLFVRIAHSQNLKVYTRARLRTFRYALPIQCVAHRDFLFLS